MILSCANIRKSFGDNCILNNCSFTIDDYEKIAIVGVNGVGKTTLLKILLGIYPPDEGVVARTKDKTIGYLSQLEPVNSMNTLYDEFMSIKQPLIDMENTIRTMEHDMHHIEGSTLEILLEEYSNLTTQFELLGGYQYHSDVMGVMNGLGFLESDSSRKISTFSGGQKTRVALGKILIEKPDLIILDEPTNHLDLQSVSWLEGYLQNYKGAILVVSHDRFFLDKIATKIIEIDQKTSTVFTGNYTAYAAKKEILYTAKMNAYLNNKRELKHQEEVIEKLRSFNREKSIKRAESREKLVNKMERVEKPEAQTTKLNLSLAPSKESGKDVLIVTDLSKRFDTNILFEKISFTIKKREHIALLGDNGTGKTTLLKMIHECFKKEEGSIYIGANVEIGYYDQEQQLLTNEKNLFEEIADSYPTLSITQIRNTLAAFSFTGDDVYKTIGQLSGGERGRISLAKLMLSGANLLLLDEPTNHLDIQSKEILEYALNHYDGTVFYVSHDRYFINKTASRILELDQKMLFSYMGNYMDYVEAKQLKLTLLQESKKIIPSEKEVPLSTVSMQKGRTEWTSQKETAAKIRKTKNEITQIEKEIEQIEKKLLTIQNKMILPEICSNSIKLQEFSNEHAKLQTKLDSLYDAWADLGE